MDITETTVLFHIGPLAISQAVVTTWGVMVVLLAFCAMTTRHLALRPGPLQNLLEAVVGAIEQAVQAAAPSQARRIMPFIGTLWLFLLAANLIGVVPGLTAPTTQLSVTAALASLVFVSVHWFGLRDHGWRYLRHYVSPSPLFLPFHLISEITRTAALAVRLFGNMMSLELAALIILFVAGLLVPIPILMLHIVEALVQAYIFGMLALIYIGGAVQAHTVARENEQQKE